MLAQPGIQTLIALVGGALLLWMGGGMLVGAVRGVGAVAAFYLGHISADYIWNTALSTGVGSGRRWTTEAVYRVIIGVCGLFLVYLGVVFLARGFGFTG